MPARPLVLPIAPIANYLCMFVCQSHEVPPLLEVPWRKRLTPAVPPSQRLIAGARVGLPGWARDSCRYGRAVRPTRGATSS